jgi:hypothetical protein
MKAGILFESTSLKAFEPNSLPVGTATSRISSVMTIENTASLKLMTLDLSKERWFIQLVYNGKRYGFVFD